MSPAPLLLQHIVTAQRRWGGQIRETGGDEGTDEEGHCQGTACVQCALNQFYSSFLLL